MRDPLEAPPVSRNPYAAFTTLAAALSGVGMLLGGPVPGTFETAVPGWTLMLWSVLLTVGGLASWAGLFWRDRLTGLLIERVTTAVLSAAMLSYAIAAVAVLGSKAFVFPVTTVAALAVALAWRSAQITMLLRHVRRDSVQFIADEDDS